MRTHVLVYNLALALCLFSGTASLAKKGFIRSFSTLYPYVFIGAFFDFSFSIKKYQLFSFHENIDIVTLINIYDFVFPICIVVSVLTRLFRKPAFKIIVFFPAMALLWIVLDSFLFVTINYMTSMAAILMLLIWQSKKHSLKWINGIDCLIVLNLYIMYITILQVHKIALWKNSPTMVYMDYIQGYLFILTLILINVKFWRSITH